MRLTKNLSAKFQFYRKKLNRFRGEYKNNLGKRKKIGEKLHKYKEDIKYLILLLKCYVKDCGKVYGSHTSLKNHLKLKHMLKVHNLKRKKKGVSSSDS